MEEGRRGLDRWRRQAPFRRGSRCCIQKLPPHPTKVHHLSATLDAFRLLSSTYVIELSEKFMPFIKDGVLGCAVFLFAHIVRWLTGQSCAAGVQLLPRICWFKVLPPELRLKIYGYLLSEWPYACFTGTVPVVYDPEYRRWPAILRTNHQIYLEACTVLYTEVTAVLLTSDILCLGRTIPQGFHAPRIQLWAHHPFLDPIGHYYNRFGQRISNALRPKQLALQSRFGIRFNKCPIETCTLQPVHYDCPPLNGSLEPHVFTRFQNLYFQLHLDLEMIACPYRIDGNRKIQPIGGNNFTSFLRGCSLFENIVQLVSKVPYVQQLTISIEMKSAPLLIMEYGLAGYTERNFTKLYFDIHSKACEELVDSGVLDKFLRLSNVKKFDVVFVRAGVDPMQDKNVRDLERAVEQQWASRPVPELNGF